MPVEAVQFWPLRHDSGEDLSAFPRPWSREPEQSRARRFTPGPPGIGTLLLFLKLNFGGLKGRCVYLIGREPMMRISTSLLALCCQSGPDATLETPIRARSRSNGSRSLRMSPFLIARFTSASIAP